MSNQMIILDEGKPRFGNEAFCFVVRINLVIITSYEFCNYYFLEIYNCPREWISKKQCFQHQKKIVLNSKLLNRIKVYIHAKHLYLCK